MGFDEGLEGYVGTSEKCRPNRSPGGGSAASIYGNPVFRPRLKLNSQA
jgi:hypothetical protein